jgi:taurine transport system substrate-binding protein
MRSSKTAGHRILAVPVFVATVLVVLAVLVVLPPAFVGAAGRGESDSGAPSQVVIGFQVIPNGEIVAKNLGWVEEEVDVPVRWVQFNSGTELNAAIASESVDIGLGGSSTTVAAIAQGVPAQVIWIQNIIGENEALVVRRDSPIRSVADLTGRRVAAPFGATTHYHLMVALELAGVDPSTLTIMDLAPPDMRAAWLRGDIDAGFVWEPTLASMLEMDGRVLVSSGELAEQGFLTGDITIVRTGFAERHPELVQQYLRAQIRAVELIRDDPEAAAEAIGLEFDLSREEARRQMDSLVFLSGTEQLSTQYLGGAGTSGDLADVFVATGAFLAEQGTLPAAPARELFDAAINSGFLEAALAERR